MRTTRTRTTEDRFYAGFDLSLTASGVVVLNQDGKIIARKVIKPKCFGAERLNDIQNEIRAILSGRVPSLVCIEGYSMGFGAGKKKDGDGMAHAPMGRLANLGELGGVIRLLLYRMGVEYLEPTPTQLKKFATDKGVGPKDQISMHVFKRWGFEATDNNEADAYVLARIALTLGGCCGTETKAQQEVINIIRNPPKKKAKKKNE